MGLISSPAQETDGGFWICQSRAKQRCWACRQGEGCLGMYVAASMIHTVKCIFPASPLPSSALLPWLSSSGRNPSSPQAGQTPGTTLTAHGGGLHHRARERESRAAHQPPPLATPPGHSPNYLVHSSFSPQAVPACQGNPRGCCNWLKTTSPVSWFEFSLCLQRQKKKK